MWKIHDQLWECDICGSIVRRDQIEGELFTEPNLRPTTEVEKAEDLAEQALQMDEAEIEDLVHTALEETKFESSELRPELGYEVEPEEDQTEVY